MGDDERLPATVDDSRPRADSRFRWANVLTTLALAGAAGSLFLHDAMHLPNSKFLALAAAMGGLAGIMTNVVNAYASDAPRPAVVGRVNGKLALMMTPNDLDGAVSFEDVAASAYRIGTEVIVVARDGSVSTIAAPTESRAIEIVREICPTNRLVRVPLGRASKLSSAASRLFLTTMLFFISMLMAAVFGTGLADTLDLVRSEKIGALFVVGAMVASTALGALSTSKKFRGRMAIVGDDAVLLDVEPRPLALADLVRVGPRPPTRESSAAGVLFETKDRKVDLLVEPRGQGEKWSAHLLSVVAAKRAARASSDPALRARIGRGSRSVSEWRVALDKSASIEAGYRELAVEEAALLEMLEDGHVARDAKEGAAYLLSKVAADRAVALTRDATRGMVVAKDRARIVAAAEGRLKR